MIKLSELVALESFVGYRTGCSVPYHMQGAGVMAFQRSVVHISKVMALFMVVLTHPSVHLCRARFLSTYESFVFAIVCI